MVGYLPMAFNGSVLKELLFYRFIWLDAILRVFDGIKVIKS